ncbi:translation initiation factor eIF-4A (nucleomorph) [Lotharella oceanica]|uniref:Translation initiation factor eIF-4A n=1 Tax=Lotharella oceanica TaxID=641309 RepID=A0A060DAY9_9EUKA|nr:translation initiation factor eIF4A [Lotharella oceanica]AIB09851.1 translation initiation factor eIF-4A [Lotharella oceanica]|mmetsp:Transcript_4156/g.7997  ORF Transcript_4156/g.7997 Transcript_4156/m.7997 type:complete len:407 (-) Transcript_4156:1231-2451(-)
MEVEGIKEARCRRVQKQILLSLYHSMETPAKNRKTFGNFYLKANLKKGIKNFGLSDPTPLQTLAIKIIMGKRDLIFQAQSGTGKTTAYVIGICGSLREDISTLQTLVIVPTRELADQVNFSIASISFYQKCRSCTFYGGTWIGQDITNLRKNTTIGVGTPGRVYHLIQGGFLHTPNLRTFILDEADILLEGDFRISIYNIYRFLPHGVQNITVSATISQKTLEMTSQFMKAPYFLLVERQELTLEEIRQYYVSVAFEENKLYSLIDHFDTLVLGKTLIFCNTIRKAKWLFNKMLENNFKTGIIHGETAQEERSRITRKFRIGDITTLISTDIFSRGLDYPDMSTVINYDLPSSRELYLHRIGRVGRFGRKGVSISLIKILEIQILKDIEIYYSTSIEEIPCKFVDL